MADTTATADAPAESRVEPDGARAVLDRPAGFRITYLAIFVWMGLYLVSVEGVERWLGSVFRAEVEAATEISPAEGRIAIQIQNRVSDLVQTSPWVRYGGVRVNVTVLGADGLTPLYVGGGKIAPPPRDLSLEASFEEGMRLLPAISDVFVSVPHGSRLSIGIFAGYAALMLPGLLAYHRRIARLERALLEAAIAARDHSAAHVRAIEEELAKVRDRLREVEPELTEREIALRTTATRADDLEGERRALEELLEEALEDVSQKQGVIFSLEERLRLADRKESVQGKTRSRESERVAKRLRTLYKNLTVDDRAVADLVALGDESLKLRAEELLKRLDDDRDTAAVRRKVGGLPPHLSIFELGFAGKGRIYYSRRERGGHRVFAIGGKASQKQDLEYLSRL